MHKIFGYGRCLLFPSCLMNEIPWWSGFLLFEVDPKTFHCITHCPGVISDLGMTMSSMYCQYDIRRSFLVCFFSLYILRWSPRRLFFPFVDLFSMSVFCTMSWVVQSRPSFGFVTFITTVFGSQFTIKTDPRVRWHCNLYLYS